MDSTSLSSREITPELKKDRLHKVKGERFRIYCSAPISDVKVSAYKSAVFEILSGSKKSCDLHIVSDVKMRPSIFSVYQILGKFEEPVQIESSSALALVYKVEGNAKVKIRWS